MFERSDLYKVVSIQDWFWQPQFNLTPITWSEASARTRKHGEAHVRWHRDAEDAELETELTRTDDEKRDALMSLTEFNEIASTVDHGLL